MNGDERETRSLLKQHGKLVRTSGGHEIHKMGDGGMIVVAARGRKSVGSSEFWKRALNDTRKAVDRARGLKPAATGLVDKVRLNRHYQRYGKMEDALFTEWASSKESIVFCTRCGARAGLKVFRERTQGIFGVRKFRVCACGHEEEIG